MNKLRKIYDKSLRENNFTVIRSDELSLIYVFHFPRQTETSEARSKFINSVNRILNDHDFDGIDLGWQFPPVKVKKNRGTWGSLWHGIKKTFGYGKFKDDKEQEHRDGFTILVRDLKTQLRPKGKALTLTVLPHINASGTCSLFFPSFFFSFAIPFIIIHRLFRGNCILRAIYESV